MSELKPIGAWFARDYADGWIKFYDVDAVIDYARETGALIRYWDGNGSPPIISHTENAVADLKFLKRNLSGQGYASEYINECDGWNAAIDHIKANYVSYRVLEKGER